MQKCELVMHTSCYPQPGLYIFPLWVYIHNMVRPKCDKIVKFKGCISALIPSCPEKSKEQFLELLPEELEALRLADVNDLSQTIAAEKMGVSQSTFQRLLAAARKKAATALVEGRGINLMK